MPLTRDPADPNDPHTGHAAAMRAARTAQSVRHLEPDEVAEVVVAAARADERAALEALITAARELAATLRAEAAFLKSDRDGSSPAYLDSAEKLDALLTGTHVLAAPVPAAAIPGQVTRAGSLATVQAHLDSLLAFVVHSDGAPNIPSGAFHVTASEFAVQTQRTLALAQSRLALISRTQTAPATAPTTPLA